MEKGKKSNKIFKMLVIIFIVLGVIAMALNFYNKSIEKKTIKASVEAVETLYNGKAEYSKGMKRIIVGINNVEDEKELYELTRKVLPQLAVIGDIDYIELLSVRCYYNGDKNNPQFYDVKFKDINRIEWDKIYNFDDFLTYLNFITN